MGRPGLDSVWGPALGAAANALSRRASWRRRGTARLPGLAAAVDVTYDDDGVPHIRAATDADAFQVQGFCHGLDRLFQMDLLRRVLSGRLAETVGERRIGNSHHSALGADSTTVDADRLMRTLDLVRVAERTVREAPPGERALLDAYVRGVNAAVRLARRRRPLEYRLLGLPPAPWRARDSVLVAKGMALGLSFAWRTTPVLHALAERLGDAPRLLEGILPPTPSAGDVALARIVTRHVDGALAFLPSLPATPAGSNAFVVGGARSRSGKPLLASDPHLELSLPSVWFLASVRGADYAAVGASLPGLPGVVIGRTPSFAWGLTNAMLDDGDLWAETVDGPGSRYRVEGRWRPLEIETQEIKRRGRAPVLFRLRRTHRGPLLTDAFPGWTGAPLSLRLALHEPAPELQVFLALGRARRVGDAREAALRFGSPAQNILFADAHGDAGYMLMGRVPDRAPHAVHPGLVRDGEDRSTDWTGWVSPDRLPAFALGREDAVVSANEPHVADSGAPYLSHLYEPSYRAERIRARLAGRGDLTVDDLASIQMDAFNGATTWFRRLVVTPHAETVRRMRPAVGRSVDRLLAWDGIETPGATGPAIWHLTYHHLLRRIFSAKLGEDLLERWLGLVNLVDAPLRRAFEDPDSPWAPPAARAALLLRAIEDAEQDLRRRGLAPDVPWGRIHTLLLRHPLSAVPALGRAWTRGPYPLRGGPFAPCSGQYAHPRPAGVVAGASYRQVVDLADPEGTGRMVLLGGQSGHIGSAHYSDQVERWRAGGGLPMRLETEPSTRRRLRLEPA